MQVIKQPVLLFLSQSLKAVMLVSRGRWRVFGRRVGHAGCIWSDDMGVA